jgi:hypothetical protein
MRRFVIALLAATGILVPGARAQDRADADLPAFLRDDTRPPRLRAVRIRNGEVRARRDGVAVNDPTGNPEHWVLSVLDADEEGHPPWPRILCHGGADPLGNDEIAVALHVARDSLATVALRGAVLRTTPARRRSNPWREPGLYFEPGAVLEIAGVEGSATRVRFSGFMVTAAGFVDTRRIGYAYEPHEGVEPPTWNAELPLGATFLDAPSGRTIATLEPYPSSEQRHHARVIGPRRADHRLVRVQRDDLTLVGWVQASDVVEVAGRALGGGYGFGGGGRAVPDHAVSLPAGTRLLDDAAGNVIGRLRTPAELECLDGCDGDRPRVIVPTCVGMVRLFTEPPP